MLTAGDFTTASKVCIKCLKIPKKFQPGTPTGRLLDLTLGMGFEPGSASHGYLLSNGFNLYPNSDLATKLKVKHYIALTMV